MSELAEGEIVETTSRSLAVRDELDVEDLIAQVGKIHRLMKNVMKAGEHYGVIPGATKPSLLQPGAEKIALLFRLDPQFQRTKTFDGNHLTVESTVTLYHIPTGNRIGSAGGICSTKESKYAYRNASRLCPSCGKDCIIKGKAEYGGGWICFAKKGGCGAKYADNDKSITGQPVGRAANEDLPDLWNTIEQMADKRALVAAVKRATAASDIFTQDIEEHPPTTSPTRVDEHVEHRAHVQQSNGVPITVDNAVEQAEIAEAVAKWKPFIDSICTPQAATAAITEINEDLAGEPQKVVKRLLAEAAKSLGYVFDKEAKRFFAKQDETAMADD